MCTLKNTKLLLASLLLLLSSSAWAEWDNLDVNQSGLWVVDRSTIRKDGTNRKVWIAVNLFKPDQYGSKSIRGKTEIDCKNEKSRELTADHFSDVLAEGNILKSHLIPTSWLEIPPDTVYWKLMKIVCAQ